MADIFVTDEVLTEGVAAAWLLLALLGVLLVAIAVWVADRLSKSPGEFNVFLADWLP